MSKKAEKSLKEHSSYDLRDVVLAKVRGYPPWPGMIVDPDNVPPSVTKERPTSKKTNFYCVRFFPVGDYAWLVAKDISKLQTHEIEAYINEPVKRSGDLLSGYKIALDPASWEAEREAAQMEDVEAEANAEIDQLASEDEGVGEKKPTKAKKRKRESEAAPAAKSKSKSKPKKDSAEPTGKKKSGGTKGRKNGTKSKTLVESEDDGDHDEPEPEDEDAGPSKKASPPPTKKSKRDKDADDEVDPSVANDPEAVKIRDWRHKLQKTFLSQKVQPKDEEMPDVDKLFTTVEQYEGITIQYLLFSKIGKVMRHIAALSQDKIPRDSEFGFKDRAKVLVDRWQEVLNASKANGADGGPDGPIKDGPAANGNVEGDRTMQGEVESAAVQSQPDLSAAGETSAPGDVTMSEA